MAAGPILRGGPSRPPDKSDGYTGKPGGYTRGALLLVVLLLFSRASAASTVVPMSLADLTSAATLIVDGRITDVRHVTSTAGAERVLVVHVTSSWKGDAGTVVYVRLPGGTIGRYQTIVPGVPSVSAGDRFIWFLGPSARGGHVVLGLHQGAMRVTRAGGRPVVLTPVSRAGVIVRGDVGHAPRRLAVFAADVRRLVGAAAAQ